MDILITLVLIVAVGALIYFNRSSRSLDINQDGKVDAADAVQAVVNAAEDAKQTVKKAAVKAKSAGNSTARKTGAKRSNTRKTSASKK